MTKKEGPKGPIALGSGIWPVYDTYLVYYGTV